jgi:hypothetical protein
MTLLLLIHHVTTAAAMDRHVPMEAARLNASHQFTILPFSVMLDGLLVLRFPA